MANFQRNLFPLRGQFDLAPHLSVLFLLLFLIVAGGHLILPTGTRIELPPGGARKPAWDGAPYLVVAVDANEQCYFENQVYPNLALLRDRLAARSSGPRGPRRLYLEADRRVRHGRLTELGDLAREAGLTEILLGTATGSPSP